MRTGAANHLKTVGGCLKDLDHLLRTRGAFTLTVVTGTSFNISIGDFVPHEDCGNRKMTLGDGFVL
jgi:hypothetical protein